jgi:hypothetical protein
VWCVTPLSFHLWLLQVCAASQSNLPLTPARAALQSQGLDQILIQKEGQQYPLCILRQRLAFPRSSTITFQFERRHTLLLDDPRNKPLPSNDHIGGSTLHGSLQPGQPTLNSSLASNQPFSQLPNTQQSSLSGTGGATVGGAMNHNSASTPSRAPHHLPPSVIVSPSGPVSRMPHSDS